MEVGNQRDTKNAKERETKNQTCAVLKSDVNNPVHRDNMQHATMTKRERRRNEMRKAAELMTRMRKDDDTVPENWVRLFRETTGKAKRGSGTPPLKLKPKSRKRGNGKADTGGMENIGNTCYLNAGIHTCQQSKTEMTCEQVLRALFSSPKVRMVVLDAKLETTIVPHSELLRELRQLFQEMQAQGTKSVSPRAFVNALGVRNPRYLHANQEDADEFLRDIFGLLEDDFSMCTFSVATCFFVFAHRDD